MYVSKKWYASRKLWIAVATGATAILNEVFGWGLSSEALVPLVLGAVAYITGQTFVDVQTVKQEGEAFKVIKDAEASVFVKQATSPQPEAENVVAFTPDGSLD